MYVPNFAISDIAFDPNTQILYGYSNHSLSLLTVDTTTGESQLVAISGIRKVTGMAYDSDNNTLYAIIDDKKLYQLNTSTGAASVVPSIKDRATSLTYNTQSKELLAHVSYPNSEYVSVDPAIRNAFISGNSAFCCTTF